MDALARRLLHSSISLKSYRMTPPNYDSFLSKTSKARTPSAIRALMPLVSIPGMINLGGGLPNPSTFPFAAMTVTLKDSTTLTVSESEMQRALQYSSTTGLPDLLSWIRQLQTSVHSPSTEFEVCLGNGSQDVLTKAFEALINPGDHMLIESPAYVGSLAFLRPLGAKFVEVDTDSQGLNPDKLREILSSWPDVSTRPKILYTVPCGGNPTGTSTNLIRKRQILEIAFEFDLLILEDDPYYYLQYGEAIQSYFSLDTNGRVVRFDSLSKILSAGVRIGWVTGPKAIVDRIALHSQSTSLHPSGISQTLILTLLNHWDRDASKCVPKFLAHTRQVTALYERQCKLFSKYLTKHLSMLAVWSEPSAGMFYWLSLPSVHDTSKLIKTHAREKLILLVPGEEFLPNKSSETSCGFVRASFSTVTEDEMDVALGRLADLIRENKN